MLDGGVFHADNGSETFTRSLGSSGGAVEWTANGGGFSAGDGTLTVNIGGNATPSTLNWGTTVGSQIVGTLKFGSTFAANLVDFRNGINLGSDVHTIQVDDNLLSSADSAQISGSLTGTGGITKTGPGLLKLMGVNTYTGVTTVAEGTLAFGSSSTSMAAGNYAVSGGTLNIRALSKTIGSLQTTGGIITGSGGRLTSSAGFNVQGGTISVNLYGVGRHSRKPGRARPS